MIITLSSCSKQTAGNNSLIVGQWNFIKAEHTLYTPDGTTVKDTLYNDTLHYLFTYRGYLVIKSALADTMWYTLEGTDLLRIKTSTEIYNDTILFLDQSNLVFKESHTQRNGNRTFSIVYLDR